MLMSLRNNGGRVVDSTSWKGRQWEWKVMGVCEMLLPLSSTPFESTFGGEGTGFGDGLSE